MGVTSSEPVVETAPPAPPRPRRGAGLRSAARRLFAPPETRLALGLWLLTRVGVGVLVWITVWTDAAPSAHVPESVSQVWQHWDWVRYLDIAEHGYSLRKIHGASIAFFPGFPALIYLTHLIVHQWVLTGLVISFVSGAVACVALARLIGYEADAWAGRDSRAEDGADGATGADGETAAAGGEAAADRAEPTAGGSAPLSPALRHRLAAINNGLTMFLFSPAAVFLAIGYTESIFLAFALPAWLAARRRRWVPAGLLTAGATAIRIDGLFLFAALALMFLLTRPRGARAWLHGSGLLAGLVPPAAFFTYLYSLTGDWLAWSHAEAQGWDRTTNDPIRTFRDTLRYAFSPLLPAAQAWEYQLEFAAVAGGFAILAWLLWKRRWPEAVYVGVPVVSLATSHVYLSVTRELLLWWPIWAVLGVWSVRRPWVKTVFLVISAPLMFAVGYLFFTGRWAG